MMRFIMKEKASQHVENLLKLFGCPIELQAAILNFLGGHKIVLKSGEKKSNHR